MEMCSLPIDYEHTVSGLLRKRADLFCEAERIRDRLAEIRNDIEALDRVLISFGYKGDFDTMMPRQKRHVIFGQGELSKALLREIRDAHGPLSSRELAQSILVLQGNDIRDRKLLSDLTRRVSKALRVHRDNGLIRSATDENGRLVWMVLDRLAHAKAINHIEAEADD